MSLGFFLNFAKKKKYRDRHNNKESISDLPLETPQQATLPYNLHHMYMYQVGICSYFGLFCILVSIFHISKSH